MAGEDRGVTQMRWPQMTSSQNSSRESLAYVRLLRWLSTANYRPRNIQTQNSDLHVNEAHSARWFKGLKGEIIGARALKFVPA